MMEEPDERRARKRCKLTYTIIFALHFLTLGGGLLVSGRLGMICFLGSLLLLIPFSWLWTTVLIWLTSLPTGSYETSMCRTFIAKEMSERSKDAIRILRVDGLITYLVMTILLAGVFGLMDKGLIPYLLGEGARMGGETALYYLTVSSTTSIVALSFMEKNRTIFFKLPGEESSSLQRREKYLVRRIFLFLIYMILFTFLSLWLRGGIEDLPFVLVWSSLCSFFFSFKLVQPEKLRWPMRLFKGGGINRTR